jgi:hypothetical protein
VVEHAHQRAGRKEPDDPKGKDAGTHSTNKTHYRFTATAFRQAMVVSTLLNLSAYLGTL